MAKKFRVSLSGIGSVSADVEVEAESADEAETKAMEIAKKGDASWEYNGIEVVEDSMTVEEVHDV